MRLSLFLLTAAAISGALSRPADSSGTQRVERGRSGPAEGEVLVPRQVDAALEPDFGDLPRSELMEDGVRIWWSKKGVNEQTFVHVVGGLVLQEGQLLRELIATDDVSTERARRLCETHYRPLFNEWLERRRGLNLEAFTYQAVFSERNGNLASQFQVGPFRGYVGLFMRVAPLPRQSSGGTRFDSEALAAAVLEYFHTVRPSFDHRAEEVGDIFNHGLFIRGPQKSRPVPVDSPRSAPIPGPPPPFAVRGFRIIASHHADEYTLRVRVLGGLRVTDTRVATALSFGGGGAGVAAAFFSHMRRYCAFFGNLNRPAGEGVAWAPVFQGFAGGGNAAPEGVVGVFAEKSYIKVGPEWAERVRTADAQKFESYFRDLGWPAEIEWVADAFDRDGLKAPKLAPQHPDDEPRIKTGKSPVSGGDVEVDLKRIFRVEEVKVDKLEPAV